MRHYIANVLQCNWELSINTSTNEKERDQTDPLPCRNQIEQSSRLDQTEVSILTLVKHAEAVCIRVAKDDELIMAP